MINVFCGLLSLYPPVHLLSIWLSGTIAITNSDGDIAFPWNILLLIFTFFFLMSIPLSSFLDYEVVIKSVPVTICITEDLKANKCM